MGTRGIIARNNKEENNELWMRLLRCNKRQRNLTDEAVYIIIPNLLCSSMSLVDLLQEPFCLIVAASTSTHTRHSWKQSDPGLTSTSSKG